MTTFLITLVGIAALVAIVCIVAACEAHTRATRNMRTCSDLDMRMLFTAPEDVDTQPLAIIP